MVRCTVVNLRKEPYDVYIGRPGHGEDGYFGNPYAVAIHGQSAISLFREEFLFRIENEPEYKSRILELRGKRLGCFCKPKACHGDIIANYVNTHFGD